ncbi:MAG: hypothetical protein Q4C95_09475 [Planctomycetia bacterium]|nr:hypothetical protein [Planctomycetia bacterium]
MNNITKYILMIIAGLIIISIEENHLFAQSGNVALKNGGIVYGNVQKTESDDCQIELPGGGTLILEANLIQTTHIPSDAQLWYRQTTPLSKDDIETHWEIAKACSQKGLTEEANKHYQRILEIDPEHLETHKMLKHEKIDGVWMSRKERLEKSGYQRFNGQIMTLQEVELEKMRQQNKEDAKFWKRKIKELYSKMQEGFLPTPDDIGMIHSPTALEPVSDFFQQEQNPEIRIIFVQIIGKIGTPAAMSFLGNVVLIDPDDEVRLTALEMIKRKRTAIPGAIEFFRHRLRMSSDNAQINRAGFALGFFEAKDAVPDLIAALITDHRRTIVLGGSDKTGATFDSNGGLRNFSTGGGVKTKVVTEALNNDAVLNALVRIVSIHYHPAVDYRYDVESWRLWFMNQLQLYHFNARRNF